MINSKYIKYKTKYLELNKMIGGGLGDEKTSGSGGAAGGAAGGGAAAGGAEGAAFDKYVEDLKELHKMGRAVFEHKQQIIQWYKIYDEMGLKTLLEELQLDLNIKDPKYIAAEFAYKYFRYYTPPDTYIVPSSETLTEAEKIAIVVFNLRKKIKECVNIGKGKRELVIEIDSVPLTMDGAIALQFAHNNYDVLRPIIIKENRES